MHRRFIEYAQVTLQPRPVFGGGIIRIFDERACALFVQYSKAHTLLSREIVKKDSLSFSQDGVYLLNPTLYRLGSIPLGIVCHIAVGGVRAGAMNGDLNQRSLC